MSDEITVVESSPQPIQHEAPKPEAPKPEAAKPDVPRAPDGKFAPREDAPTPDPVDPPPAEVVQPEKKVNRTTEFIERLKGENGEMRRKLAELEARLPKAPEPTPPDPQNFYQDPQGWLQANNEHLLQQARQQWENEQRQAQEQAKNQEALTRWDSRINELEATHPGIRDALDSIPEQILTPDFARAIVGHESGAEVAYHLAQNPGELYQIVGLPPQVIGYAVDAIASRITAAQPQAPTPAVAAPAKPVTRAPAPVTTLSGSPSVNKSYDDLSTEEYDQRRTKERRERGLR